MNLRQVLKATQFIGDSEGKGTLGCLIFVVLFCVASLVGARVIPVYYAFSSFETAVKTEISRAGAHFYDDETVIKNVLEIAKRNEIAIKREDVKLQRLAGQVHLTIQYSVPVDLMVYEYVMNFNVKASSYIGTL